MFLPELVHYARTDWYGPLLVHPVRKLVDLDAGRRAGRRRACSRSQAGRSAPHLRRRSRDRSPFNPGGGFTIVAAAEGAFALVGAALALARPRRPLAGFLLGWLAVGLATNVLDTRPPQANHLIGVAMLPAAFAALAVHAAAGALAPRCAPPARSRRRRRSRSPRAIAAQSARSTLRDRALAAAASPRSRPRSAA